jgi:hypothetical protein
MAASSPLVSTWHCRSASESAEHTVGLRLRWMDHRMDAESNACAPVGGQGCVSKASTAQHAEAPHCAHMCTWPVRSVHSINPAGAIGCSGTVTAAAASHSSGSAKDAQATAAGSVAPSPPKLVQPAHFGLPIAANAWSNVNSNSKVTAACTPWPAPAVPPCQRTHCLQPQAAVA